MIGDDSFIRLRYAAMTMTRISTLLALFLSASFSHANPALLGIEPHITTVGELRAKNENVEMIVEVTPEFGGPIYRIEGSDTGAEDVYEARFIFNRNGIPVAMTGVFARAKFDHINLILGTRYKLLHHNNRPGIENRLRSAWYQTNDRADTMVSVTAPKGSDKVYVTYANQATRNRIQASLDGNFEPTEVYWWQ